MSPAVISGDPQVPTACHFDPDDPGDLSAALSYLCDPMPADSSPDDPMPGDTRCPLPCQMTRCPLTSQMNLMPGDPMPACRARQSGT
ncbi:unnamed protein product [Staurois parvus]|uniref:Uncharacterized protein n=1 Tax=Staurois parvus TaxID=386267 RepID=A0ABN9CDL8_9NEOB|nr:unnamed protein product [Staurois parvus]